MAEKDKKIETKEFSRRQFLKYAGGVAAGVAFGGALPRIIDLGDGVVAYPAAGGYLLVDTWKCSGCMSCMMSCSLAHEGKVNPSLSRIQVVQDAFGRFPDDISQEQCRQCVYPACAEACPTGALGTDKENGNIRVVDDRKCIGCQQCVEACPHTPSRAIWNYEDKCSMKCDLCANTPHWKETGGPEGKQACVSVCPMQAIKFTTEIPTQDKSGYTVNLRDANWNKLGITTGGAGGGH